MRVECKTVLPGPNDPIVGSPARDDEELEACARTGDVDAFGELVQRYAYAVYYMIHYRVGDPFETERLVVQVFSATWRDLQRPRCRSRSFVVVLNHAVAMYLADVEPPGNPGR